MNKQIEKQSREKHLREKHLRGKQTQNLPKRDEEPLGLTEMMVFCPPCENPNCKEKDCGQVGLSSACHSPGGTQITIGSGVIDLHCRSCGQLFLSCYATDVDLLPQTCHPRGGCDVSIARKTGHLTMRCHLRFAQLGGAVVTEAPKEAGATNKEAVVINEPVAASARSWNNPPRDLICGRPAAPRDQAMMGKSRRSTRLSSRDARATITLPLDRGGSLSLSTEGSLVTLVAEDAGSLGLTTILEKDDFKKGLQVGGLWQWPGVGWLVASPLGYGRARLCLVPAHGAGNVTTIPSSASKSRAVKSRAKGSDSSGFSFTATLLLAEVMERL
jgi:hypothetical protein